MCSACSQNRLELRQRVHVTDPSNKPERVCDNCYASLTQRQDQPPPPSVAATVVSKALLQQAGPHPSNHHDNNSEESEDSDDSETEVKVDTVKNNATVKELAEVTNITAGLDKSTIDEPTPPPRRKKEQKRLPSINKPPVVARTKKDFTQLHQDFAPSELLEQRKLSDVTMTTSDDADNVPDKPRRKRRHFKSPDHVSQGEDEEATTTDDLISNDIIDVTTDEQLVTTTTTSELTSVTVTDDVIDDDVTDVTEHIIDHVIPSDDQLISDDQLHTQDVTTDNVTTSKDSPGEH